MAKMQAVSNYFNTEEGVRGCNDINYNSFITYMKNTRYGGAQSCKLNEKKRRDGYFPARAWYWQTCTEFAYFQSTDSSTAGPFFGGVGNVNVT